ncbi:DNA-processing protein DprA [Gilvimarinus agarilyticus]|uniref:DNA-processing protein DprA n=1 Tax=Gilvimarinus agarilyticus TaxID=679259 RepID=UPI00059FDC19|nr:DNA-processing protein DprA [Gilvimarinus agarilyticus]
MDGQTSLASLLTLLRLPGLGATTYCDLHRHFGSATAIYRADTATLRPWLEPSSLQLLQRVRDDAAHEWHQAVARELEWLGEHPDVRPVEWGAEEYPALLAQIACAPALLYVRGALDAIELPQLAIVGSRNPSSGGQSNAHEFARYLAGGGFAITSGLALGVDACAHRGALDAGGVTIAVLGTGIDRVYPARHRSLAAEILDKGGALVSEFPLGTGSSASNFPRRNRIISGLSLGTLVAEAAVKSGSLITARYALEHEREVFAIPGSIHNPMAKGCHALIKRGAKLVESATDIVEELGGALAFKSQQLGGSAPDCSHLSAQQRQLLELVGYDPVSLDTLCQRSALEPGALAAELMTLELEGLVSQTGSLYCRC